MNLELMKSSMLPANWANGWSDLVRKHGQLALDLVQDPKIESHPEAEAAKEVGIFLNKMFKEFELRCREEIQPHQTRVNQIRRTWRQYTTELGNARDLLRKALGAYQREQVAKEQDKALAQEIARIEQRQNGQSSPERPMPEPTKIVPLRKTWKFEVVEEARVPREFLTLDEAKLKTAIKAGERNIPGVRIYQEETAVLK